MPEARTTSKRRRENSINTSNKWISGIARQDWAGKIWSRFKKGSWSSIKYLRSAAPSSLNQVMDPFCQSWAAVSTDPDPKSCLALWGENPTVKWGIENVGKALGIKIPSLTLPLGSSFPNGTGTSSPCIHFWGLIPSLIPWTQTAQARSSSTEILLFPDPGISTILSSFIWNVNSPAPMLFQETRLALCLF